MNNQSNKHDQNEEKVSKKSVTNKKQSDSTKKPIEHSIKKTGSSKGHAKFENPSDDPA